MAHDDIRLLPEWVSISKATALLNEDGDPVERSVLSRYVTQHADALETRIRGRQTQVRFDQLAAHRQENIRLAKPLGESAGEGRRTESQATATARKITAEAELKEMEVAARRGELMPRAEVDRAGRDAFALMRSAFDRALETTAADLSVKYGWDERAARLALKAFAELGQETFHRELLARLDAKQRRRVAGEDDDAEDALQ